uniref:toll/interleukin-1 receptor domain-containing protein n=1 Tax=unclassified Frankia TaxID=2632575 RepID=UPI002AD38F89
MSSDAAGQDGVLRQSVPDGTWAWVGVRLAPMTPTVGSGLYTDLGEPRRRADAFTAEVAWVSAQQEIATGPAPAARPRFDLRYLSDPRSASVSCALLGRVFAHNDTAATDAALTLRARLAAVPRHVQARPILDAAEVQGWLAPIGLHPDGLVEIRKRLTHSRCSRPEPVDPNFGRPFCFAMSAFIGGDRSWEPLWLALAQQRQPTLISVCLEPYAVGDRLRYELAKLAGQYAALAREIPATQFRGRVPADAFAIEAQPLYAEAVRRYTDRAYRIRVSVASAGPLAPAFGELLAATISPPVRDGAFGGGGAVARRPPPEDIRPAWVNITTLGREWLDATYRQGSPPGLLNEPERILCELVDVPEAAVAFRFPYEVAGRPRLFDLRERAAIEAADRAARSTVFLCHAEDDGAAAANLYTHLRSDGLRGLWLEAENLGAGQDRQEEIKKAIERSRAVVVCLSSAVSRPGSVNRQIAWALDVAMEQPQGAVFMIPARL